MTTIDSARGSTHKNDKGEVIVDKKPQPAYYMLLPLTVPGDIVLTPIQIIIFGPFYLAGWRS